MCRCARPGPRRRSPTSRNSRTTRARPRRGLIASTAPRGGLSALSTAPSPGLSVLSAPPDLSVPADLSAPADEDAAPEGTGYAARRAGDGGRRPG